MVSNSNREVAVADKHKRGERARGREMEWGPGFGVPWSRFLSLSEGRGDLGLITPYGVCTNVQGLQLARLEKNDEIQRRRYGHTFH